MSDHIYWRCYWLSIFEYKSASSDRRCQKWKCWEWQYWDGWDFVDHSAFGVIFSWCGWSFSQSSQELCKCMLCGRNNRWNRINIIQKIRSKYFRYFSKSHCLSDRIAYFSILGPSSSVSEFQFLFWFLIDKSWNKIHHLASLSNRFIDARNFTKKSILCPNLLDDAQMEFSCDQQSRLSMAMMTSLCNVFFKKKYLDKCLRICEVERFFQL